MELAGKIIALNTLQVSKKGNKFIEFVVEADNGTRFACLSFFELASEIATKTLGAEFVGQGELKDDKVFIKTLAGSKAVKGDIKKKYDFIPTPRTLMDDLMDKLGGAYVSTRCREFVRGRGWIALMADRKFPAEWEKFKTELIEEAGKEKI